MPLGVGLAWIKQAVKVWGVLSFALSQFTCSAGSVNHIFHPRIANISNAWLVTHKKSKQRCRASLLLPLSRCCPPPQPRLLSSRTRSQSFQGGVESSRRPSTVATLTQVSVCHCLSCCRVCGHVFECRTVHSLFHRRVTPPRTDDAVIWPRHGAIVYRAGHA